MAPFDMPDQYLQAGGPSNYALTKKTALPQKWEKKNQSI